MKKDCVGCTTRVRLRSKNMSARHKYKGYSRSGQLLRNIFANVLDLLPSLQRRHSDPKYSLGRHHSVPKYSPAPIRIRTYTNIRFSLRRCTNFKVLTSAAPSPDPYSAHSLLALQCFSPRLRRSHSTYEYTRRRHARRRRRSSSLVLASMAQPVTVRNTVLSLVYSTTGDLASNGTRDVHLFSSSYATNNRKLYGTSVFPLLRSHDSTSTCRIYLSTPSGHPSNATRRIDFFLSCRAPLQQCCNSES